MTPNTSWMPAEITANWSLAAPIFSLVIAGLIAMMVDVFARDKAMVAYVAVAGMLASAWSCVHLWGTNPAPTFGLKALPMSGQMVADNYALLLDGIFLIAGLATVLASLDYLKDQRLVHGEYYILLLFAMSGMMLMVQATELITIFVALETFSIALYVLSAFARRRKRSAEAGLKYLLLGAFSSAFFLYGIALVYGALGTTNLLEISQIMAGGAMGIAQQNGHLLAGGIGLLLVGLGFKVAAVPFHVWTPDVYEGAPTPITGFMSVATKAAAFGVLARILLFAVPSARPEWAPLVAAMSVATMVVGNVVAIRQQNVKRLLAYSSIAHAGYLLIAIVVQDATSMLFYLLCYAVMNLGAFAVVTYLAHDGREYSDIADFRGLFHTNLPMAAAMAVFMFSLAGIPFSIGFNGKFVLFLNAVGKGYAGLVIVAVLASAVSAFYYLRVIVAMWMRARDEHTAPAPATVAPSLASVVAVCGVLTVLMGVVVNPLLRLASSASPTDTTSMARVRK